MNYRRFRKWLTCIICRGEGEDRRLLLSRGNNQKLEGDASREEYAVREGAESHAAKAGCRCVDMFLEKGLGIAGLEPIAVGMPIDITEDHKLQSLLATASAST